MLKRRALIGLIAAIIGTAAMPAVSFSAGTGQRHGQYAAGSSRSSKAKAKKCKKGQVRKHGKCVKKPTTPPSSTTPPPTSTPEAMSATLVIHVSKAGQPDEGAALHIAKLIDSQPVRGLETSEHTLHVTPGQYEITVINILNPTTVGFLARKIVTVSAGQTAEVTLELE
jgi:hypothetical protein